MSIVKNAFNFHLISKTKIILLFYFSFSKSQLVNEKPGEKQLAPTNGKIATQAKEEEAKEGKKEQEKKDKEEESWEVVKPKMSDNKIETNGIVKKIQ